MKNKPRLRLFVMGVLLLGMMSALIVQLGALTLKEGKAYAAAAENKSLRTMRATASRGRILDRNGVPLAYDETSYNVQFSRDPERRSELSALYTESLIEAIRIIEEGGGSIIDTFYIKMNDMCEPYYDFGVTSEDAVKARYKNFCQAMSFYIPDENDMRTWKTAEDAYLFLRETWKIPEEMPYEEARKIMSVRQEINMNQWRAYEPITISYNVPMEVVAQLDMRSDELLGVSTTRSTFRVYPWGTTAAHMIGYLSRQVGEMSEGNMQRMGYSQEDYEIYDKVYKLDENGEFALEPNTNQRIVQMQRMGYTTEDYIGVAGIEKTMEKHLTASTDEKRGTRTVETNKSGIIMREMQRTAPSAGNDVMLTIDLPLQRVTEAALENAIRKIREYEEDWLSAHPEQYEDLREDLSTIKMAETGSIVVLDAFSGKLLAMASYPTFDPNTFMAGPLSDEDFEKLYGEKSGMPTLNRAIASKLAPGSIFKLTTGLAGLMEGVITPQTRISDGHVPAIDANGRIVSTNVKTEKGRYTHFLDATEPVLTGVPKCWVGNPSKHANLDISEALAKSCNYYFFTIADAIGIVKLNDWATRLGLNDLTNIELPGEVQSHVGGQSALYDNTLPLAQQKSSLPSLIYRTLKEDLREIVRRMEREATEEMIEQCAARILRLQKGYGTSQEFGEDIRLILKEELGFPVSLSRGQRWSQDLTSRLLELNWKPAMTVRTGMGQGVALTSPVAIARYAAAFANGGTVYDVHVVDRVIDEHGSVTKVFEPTIFDQIDAPDEYWEAIREGLMQVVSPEYGGTAADAFTEEFQQTYMKKIIGKSGTAQISASNNVDIENTSWFITMAPRENPEIVIITCLPNGMSGSCGSGPAIEEIVRFYIDRKEGAAQENLVGQNGLTP